jgi:hypothetical protein
VLLLLRVQRVMVEADIDEWGGLERWSGGVDWSGWRRGVGVGVGALWSISWWCIVLGVSVVLSMARAEQQEQATGSTKRHQATPRRQESPQPRRFPLPMARTGRSLPVHLLHSITPHLTNSASSRLHHGRRPSSEHGRG